MVKSEFHPEPPGSQNPHKSPQHHAVNIQAMDIGIGMKSVHEMEKRVSGLLFLRSHGCEHELELSGEGNGRAREDAPFFNLGDGSCLEISFHGDEEVKWRRSCINTQASSFPLLSEPPSHDSYTHQEDCL